MRRLLALALLLASVSCSKDSSTNPTTESLAGTWNLSTINNLPLPFLLAEADLQTVPPTPRIELLNDQIVATSAGTFVEIANARITDGTGTFTVPFTDKGTWTLSGNTITFHFDSDGSSGTGTLSGNTFTIGETDFKSVYVKQ
jgi:hypothetical protein